MTDEAKPKKAPARKRGPKKVDPVLEAVPDQPPIPEQPEEDEVLDAVVIVRRIVDGMVKPQILLNGSVTPDMFEGLVKIALRDFNKEMGLE